MEGNITKCDMTTNELSAMLAGSTESSASVHQVQWILPSSASALKESLLVRLIKSLAELSPRKLRQDADRSAQKVGSVQVDLKGG